MLASCSICKDCFTGIHPESVSTTPCGHVFHYECLMTWIKRSKTCPQCRLEVTEKKIIKFFFQNNSDLSIKEDISSLTQQVQSLTYENTQKKEDIQHLLAITKRDDVILVSLKKQLKDLIVLIEGHTNSIEESRKVLVKYQSEIQTLKERNRDLETMFSQRFIKYMELKRHLRNVNSKESVNTRIMEKLRSEITDLEAETVRLQRKCEDLESLVKANDYTPRRTKLRKRIIYESPAPDLSITPSLEKGLKTVINSPENSVSSMEQPKAQFKPHSHNKTEQSSSNCIGGRLKPDVYPSRQKPVTRKRKYNKN